MQQMTSKIWVKCIKVEKKLLAGGVKVKDRDSKHYYWDRCSLHVLWYNPWLIPSNTIWKCCIDKIMEF